MRLCDTTPYYCFIHYFHIKVYMLINCGIATPLNCLSGGVIAETSCCYAFCSVGTMKTAHQMKRECCCQLKAFVKLWIDCGHYVLTTVHHSHIAAIHYLD